jgi:adenosylmethionine-8-amino-7-oxononanoate aminotransferase
VPGFLHIPSPYPYRYEAPTGVSQGIAAANELEQAILREGPDTVAMFFAEPVQGAGGVIVPQDDYFPRIREICDTYDVLLVADEVITGFGRTGKMFALDHWGVEPDMIQFAKAITSGYFSLGGIGVSDAIGEVLDREDSVWMHCYTYSGHPVGCAVALRNLQIIEEENFPAQAAAKGAALIGKLEVALADHPHVGEVRGKGLMCGVVLGQDTKAWAVQPGERRCVLPGTADCDYRRSARPHGRDPGRLNSGSTGFFSTLTCLISSFRKSPGLRNVVLGCRGRQQ